MKKILVTGTSGTGKTTLAEELSKQGYFTISIDEQEGLCSWIDIATGENHGGKEAEMTKEFVDQHDWVLDVKLLQKLIDQSLADKVFVFGMATNQKDFIHIFDQIILLHCSPDVFCKRIDERVGNNFGKNVDVQDQVIKRSESYKQEMLSLGAEVIDADKSVDEVVNQLLDQTL